MPIVLHTDEERIGTAIAGKYRIEQVLGSGGMGTVFRGVHSWTGRRVALKLLKPMFAQDPQTVTRFLHEARSAASISHPNVVEVLDMGREDDGTVYLVLELLEGESLADYLARRRKISIHDAVELLSPIMDALSAAHARGIVHRDLKPDNVFLSRDGAGRLVPKLLDFGVAKLMEPPNGSVTQTGVVIGTPLYMSPEQAGARRDIGPPADIWSMAVVLYEALSGELPYEETSTTALVVAILTTPPKPLSMREPSLPREVCDVVDRALAREPSARWGSMRELRDALARVAASIPRAPEQPSAALAHTLPGVASSDASTEARVPAGTPSELTPLPSWVDGAVATPPTLAASAAAPEPSAPSASALPVDVAPAATVAQSVETPMTWAATSPRTGGRATAWLAVGAVAVVLAIGAAVGAWALSRGDATAAQPAAGRPAGIPSVGVRPPAAAVPVAGVPSATVPSAVPPPAAGATARELGGATAASAADRPRPSPAVTAALARRSASGPRAATAPIAGAALGATGPIPAGATAVAPPPSPDPPVDTAAHDEPSRPSTRERDTRPHTGGPAAARTW